MSEVFASKSGLDLEGISDLKIDAQRKAGLHAAEKHMIFEQNYLLDEDQLEEIAREQEKRKDCTKDPNA